MDMATLFPGFQPFTLKTQSNPDITIRGCRSGDASISRPPLLLLHGFPQTLHMWHRVAPQLLDKFSVVLFDLRGYGESSKPAGDVAAYAKSAMSRDCVSVMDQLGFSDSFFVCAHDRGARVAHKLCVDYPERVRKAILLDICPTLAMYESTNFDFAQAYFHWFFLTQPEPFPEKLISGEPEFVARTFLGGRQVAGLDIFHPDCFETYLKYLKDPATVHTMCQDYRAGATLDLEESRADLEIGRLVQCPLLVLWGKHGVIEKCFDAVKEWREVTKPGVLVEGHSVDSGHYIPEQAPNDVILEIKRFFT